MKRAVCLHGISSLSLASNDIMRLFCKTMLDKRSLIYCTYILRYFHNLFVDWYACGASFNWREEEEGKHRKW